METMIDAKGKACPIPVVLAKKQIDAGQADFTVEVDNSAAVENLQRLADSQGYRTTVSSAGGAFSVTFAKAPGAAASEKEAPAPSSRTGNWVAFVPRETVGDGDPELGRSLMKMFFYTLSQSDDLPAAVLFMNGGVKLPTQDEQVIEHLRTLANRGVELLVCGTCLNFYGIADQLKLGVASNMYDIVERMQRADKVLTL